MNTLTLILTERCNLNCGYCYQMRGTGDMSFTTAMKAMDFMANHLSGRPVIKFYGGEPLLNYALIEKCIEYAENKFSRPGMLPEFTMTTNGLLLDRQKLDTLAAHRVKIYLSVDGHRAAHQTGRHEFDSVIGALERLHRHPYHQLNTLSLITPDNVRYLAESFYFLLSYQPGEMIFTLQYDRPWRSDKIELLRLQYENIATILHMAPVDGTKIMLEGYQTGSAPPFKPLRECGAGSDNLAVCPDGSLHGCVMLTPWSAQSQANRTLSNFANLAIGNIHTDTDRMILENMEALSRTNRLAGQYHKYTREKKCADCALFMSCSVCPTVSLIHSDDPFHIPDWVCRIKEAMHLKSQNAYGITG